MLHINTFVFCINVLIIILIISYSRIYSFDASRAADE